MRAKFGVDGAEIIYSPTYRFVFRNPVMRVSKWGNSLAIRIPAAVVECLELVEGDEVEVEIAGRREFGIRKRPGARALVERLGKYRGRLPEDFKFDRLEANARA